MKFWKGKPGTVKEGQVGGMDDNGFVPDSVEASKQEYLNYIESLPPQKATPESDIDKLIKYGKKEGWI